MIRTMPVGRLQIAPCVVLRRGAGAHDCGHSGACGHPSGGCSRMRWFSWQTHDQLWPHTCTGHKYMWHRYDLEAKTNRTPARSHCAPDFPQQMRDREVLEQDTQAQQTATSFSPRYDDSCGLLGAKCAHSNSMVCKSATRKDTKLRIILNTTTNEFGHSCC